VLQRMIVSICLMIIIVSAFVYPQQELYVEQIKSVEVSQLSIVNGATSLQTNLLAIILQNKTLKMFDPFSFTEKSVPQIIQPTNDVLVISRSGRTL
jgi:hypothetical protein